MKKFVPALALAASVPAFAETPAMDTAAATGILTSAQTGLTALLTAATPVISALILAGLAIWGAMALVRIVKRAFRTGS